MKKIIFLLMITYSLNALANLGDSAPNDNLSSCVLSAKGVYEIKALGGQEQSILPFALARQNPECLQQGGNLAEIETAYRKIEHNTQIAWWEGIGCIMMFTDQGMTRPEAEAKCKELGYL
jgi:hypothetical protein